MVEDTNAYSDVACSVCGRHNRDVRVVATEDGLILCQVCVAKCAAIFDEEVGLDAPEGGWTGRWPLKR
jgi:hypothetical protein